MQWGNPRELVGAALFMAFVVMAWTSLWLRGRLWFGAMMATLGAGLVILEWDVDRLTFGVKSWLEVVGLILFYALACYFVAGRYLTSTSVGDLTFQSHDALAKFIDENGETSLLSRIMRRAGPWLFAAFLIFAGFVAWAKYSGAIE